MNIIEELEFYCKEPEHVGALLLTGEWGTGKTYFIEHDLKDGLKDSCILLRVSLFGVHSLEEINKQIKNKWINESFEAKGEGGIVSFLNKAKEKLKTFEDLSDKLKKILSIDVTQFFDIQRKIYKNIKNVSSVDFCNAIRNKAVYV